MAHFPSRHQRRRISNLSFKASATKDLPSISWHLYTVLIDFSALGKTRSEVMAELRSKGVGSQVLYIPVHLQPYYRDTYGYRPGQFPVAENYYTRALSLPLYPALTDQDLEAVVSAVRSLG